MKTLLKKTFSTLKNEGFFSLLKKIKNYLLFKFTAVFRKYDYEFKDVLFINGCLLPHPQRYRVDHQIEQLESFGLSCGKVNYTDLKEDIYKYYRCLIVYRCPITPMVEKIIKHAKENNKIVFYDIDDLVFDKKYTNNLKVLKSFSKEEKELYNDGVERMGNTLKLCDYGIVSTNRLKKEMLKYVSDVYVNRNVASEEMYKYSIEALKSIKKEKNKIILGYLSGSITHNDDFKLIMPSIIKILKKYDNVYLKIVGLLDVPEEMDDIKDKILVSPFVDWKKLPHLIRSIDINLAPLENNIFNEAKSENKWLEASLVKIPTVASNVGAFKDEIVDGKTGVLCNDDEWYDKLEKLIESKKLRENIANNAYNDVIKRKITTVSGLGISNYIKSKLNRNICFVLPSTNLSGGIMVSVHHALVLKKNGYDVTLINIDKQTKKTKKIYEDKDYVNVVSIYKTEFTAYIDTLVATMWLTLKYVRGYFNCKNRKYLVQGKETGFYDHDAFERRKANSTYNNIFNLDYITVSKWCQKWLKEEFNTDSKYVKNGIDLSKFTYKERNFKNKVKILVEGNCEDSFKNVDESFKIVDKLDKNKFDIIYLSYKSSPKKWYYVNKFYQKVPHDEVAKIYKEADILLKTSLLESFSYPPIEMMATGGLCVLIKNDGNSEYVKDKENCLCFKSGDINAALEAIDTLVSNKDLRDELISNGLKTAKEYSWNNIDKNIVDLYK